MIHIPLMIDNHDYEVELYDNITAMDFLEKIPQKVKMTRWGDEIYGALREELKESGERKTFFEIGELGYWGPGNALCIFWGATPASVNDEPSMISPGIPIGKICKGDLNFLDDIMTSIKVEVG